MTSPAPSTPPTTSQHGTPLILRYFEYGHLPQGPMRAASAACCEIAHLLAEKMPPSAETSAGLRKLLEAKDCFVRAAMDADPNDYPY